MSLFLFVFQFARFTDPIMRGMIALSGESTTIFATIGCRVMKDSQSHPVRIRSEFFSFLFRKYPTKERT